MLPESWTSFNPVRLIVGAGRVDELPTIVSGRTLIVTTRGSTQRGLSTRVADGIGRDVLIHDAVRSNPTISDIDHAIDLFRDEQIDWIVGLGGGSAIDVAKVLSVALADRSRQPGGWFPPASAWKDVHPVPMVAVPTTAGTGSEVTPFATVWDAATKRKHSVGTPRMFATAAVVDPELTTSLPWDVTLSTGLDAYSQCFEAVVNRNRTPLTSDDRRTRSGAHSRRARTLRRGSRIPARALRDVAGRALLGSRDQRDADRARALDVLSDHGTPGRAARAGVRHLSAGGPPIQRRARRREPGGPGEAVEPHRCRPRSSTPSWSCSTTWMCEGPRAP